MNSAHMNTDRNGGAQTMSLPAPPCVSAPAVRDDATGNRIENTPRGQGANSAKVAAHPRSASEIPDWVLAGG